MELNYDTKTGQGRGAFNPATRVQIPKGANEIYDDSRGFKSKLSSRRKKPSKRKIRFEFKSFLNEVEETANVLSCNQLETLKSHLHQIYKRRYGRSHVLKYGNINKGFTELELQRFLRNVKTTSSCFCSNTKLILVSELAKSQSCT